MSMKLRERLESGTRLSVAKPEIALWGNFVKEKVPICTSEELYQYMEKTNTGYLVLGEEVFDSRKNLINIYEGRDDNEFELIGQFIINDAIFKLFRRLS
ncbi:MAG: hypothetical protein P8184_20890 [Calditrichia bacterium]